MQTKQISNANFKLLNEDTGEFRAVFSWFNVVDKTGDITLPSAFTDGEKVKISAWGHAWSALPIGRGTVHKDAEKAFVDGVFFISTSHGRDAYETIKGLGNDLNEFSYGFDVLDSEEKDGHRILKKLKVFEVSPVMIGAGNRTFLESIKSAGGHDAKDLLLQITKLKRRKDFQLLKEINSMRSK